MSSRAHDVAILGLDLGTRTGWALALPDGVKSRVLDCKPAAPELPGSRFRVFRDHLMWCNSRAGGMIGLVAYEGIRFAVPGHGARVAALFGGFEAVLRMWCEHHEIACVAVAPATLKKHVTGNGRATKEDMLAAIRASGQRPIDDNEADAIGLARYGARWWLDNVEGAAA